MNAILSMGVGEWWQLAGWTMLHFLWLGTLVGAAAMATRLVLRRAAASVRYAAALGWFVVLAALPMVVAAWVGGFGSGEGGVGKGIRAVDTVRFAVPRAEAKPQAARIVIKDLNAGAAGLASGGSESPTVLVESQSFEQLAVWAAHATVRYLPWLWIVGTPLTFVLLATGIVGAERLRQASRTIQEGPIAEASARLVESLRIGRRVTVAVCERIAAPVLVGIVRPIILLPPAALTGWSPEEIEMVLLHELAHVRRWDNLINLVQRIVESVLFFHPAVWLLSSWVRREREACCDAVVVGRTQRPQAYAEMLVALAAQMPRSVLFHPTATSAMAARPLRGRIRRILGIDDDPMLVSGKSLAMVMSGLLLVATLVVLNLPTRGNAKESTTEVIESTELQAPAANLDAKATRLDGASTTLDKATLDLTADKLQIGSTVIEADDGRVEVRRQESADDWPMGVVFSSPKEGEIAQRAWRQLGVKILPLTADDAVDVSQGLKVIDLLRPPGLVEPLILKNVNGMLVFDYDDLARALEQLEGSAPPWTLEYVAKTKSDLRGNVKVRIAVGPLNGQQTGKQSAQNVAKFPSLEEQKLADLAWRRLGLELEPIGAEDLKRVRALGYEGGVKVASVTDRQMGQPLNANDTLVGLHVWPTNSLKDVAEVLHRDDLAELSPLKFYVVRAVEAYEPVEGFGMGEMGGGRGMAARPVTKDKVITGRISVVLPSPTDTNGRVLTPELTADEMKQMLRSERGTVETIPQPTHYPYLPLLRRATPGEPAPPINPADYGRVGPAAVSDTGSSGSQTKQPTDLRYDGRTFDEWKDVWQTELSTDSRIKAVKALAAFGASGLGKEAAEAIMEVAPQYGPSMIAGLTGPIEGDSDSYRELIRTIFDVMGGLNSGVSPYQIPLDDKLAVIMDAANSDDPQRRIAAAAFLSRYPKHEGAMNRLLELTHDQDQRVRGWAYFLHRAITNSPHGVIDHLNRVIDKAASAEVADRAKQALQSIEKSLEDEKTSRDAMGAH